MPESKWMKEQATVKRGGWDERGGWRDVKMKVERQMETPVQVKVDWIL